MTKKQRSALQLKADLRAIRKVRLISRKRDEFREHAARCLSVHDRKRKRQAHRGY